MAKFSFFTKGVNIMSRYRIKLLCLCLLAGLSAPVSWAQPFPVLHERNDLRTMAREPFQIFDNLYFVGIGEVGSYVIETSEGLILIDTLWDNEGYTEYHLGNIRQLGLDPMDIKYVLILQGHRDHYGGARALQEVLDAQFGIAEEDRNLMVFDFGEWAPRIDFLIEEGDTLTLGDTTLEFEITPGHTPGTTSIMFSVFDDGTEHLAYLHGGPLLRYKDAALGQEFIEDLERIKQIPGIEVQVANHFDIAASGAPDLFARAELLANRQPGEPHPWVDPEHFQRWLSELIVSTHEYLAEP
jgi:metallo-beta-lactamase class B